MKNTNMANNQNVVEDALYQIRNLEETLQENAKGILQSTMSEEIKQLVKESLKESKNDEEIDEQDEPVTGGEAEMDTETEMDDEEMDDDMEVDAEMEMDDEDYEMEDEDEVEDVEMGAEDEMGDEETIDMTGASDAEVLRVFKAMGDNDGIVVKKEGENTVHLTDGDNEYMIQLGESEEDMNETIYEIEMDEEDYTMEDYTMEDDMMEDDMMGDYTMEDDMMEDDMMEDDTMEDYTMEDDMTSMEEEFDMDGIMESIKKSVSPKGVGIGKGPKFSYDKKPNMDGGFNEKRKEAFGKGTKAMGTGKAKFEYKEEKEWGGNKGDYKRSNGHKVGEKDGHFKDYEKKETKEAVRTNSYPRANKVGNRKGSDQNVNRKEIRQRPNTRVNEEVQLLKNKNDEYKKALDVFRTKLNEVAVFNSNLAYATRLFTEHSTTKQEKVNILRRFDNVESLKESKNLYRSIKDELNSGGSSSEQKLTESIERTVNRTVETGSSANLIESKTYENPQFLRMKDLMGKIK
jgi:hypothetical protein